MAYIHQCFKKILRPFELVEKVHLNLKNSGNPDIIFYLNYRVHP